MNENTIQRKMYRGIALIIALAICLTVTTFAVIYASISVEYNIFRTGRVKINLNNELPVITEDEFLFEPGMTVNKEFFIENLSTWDVYYKIYFNNVKGNLANVLEVKILDGDETLYSGTMSQLSKDNVFAVHDPLAVMEKKYLTISFHFPETAGNSTQQIELMFDMCAEAVQTKNNPSRDFD